MDRLRAQARRADELHDQSRRLLVESARAGTAAGLTQRQISEAIGRSQPEVSRLLRFNGRTPLAKVVESNRRGVLSTLSKAGGTNIRIFGSVSRGDDQPDSDLDLLVDFAEAPGLFELARLEGQLSRVVGTSVDAVPSSSLRADLADRVLDEAVPL